MEAVLRNRTKPRGAQNTARSPEPTAKMEADHGNAPCSTWVRATRRDFPLIRHIGAQPTIRTPNLRFTRALHCRCASRAGVTHEYRSRRRPVHSRSGSPAPSRHQNFPGPEPYALLPSYFRRWLRCAASPTHRTAASPHEGATPSRRATTALSVFHGDGFEPSISEVICGVPPGNQTLISEVAARRPLQLARGTLLAPAEGIEPSSRVLEALLTPRHAGKWLPSRDSNPERRG